MTSLIYKFEQIMRPQGTQLNVMHISLSMLRIKSLCAIISGETWHKALLTPYRELIADQSNDTTKVQFGEPMGSLDLVIGMWVRD